MGVIETNLSSELISQFVKATKDDKKTPTETIVHGTTVEYNGTIYVKLDGSDQLTPVNTTANVKNDERVTVLIKNHTATVTGNITSPSASSSDVKEVADQITEFEIVMAYKVSTEDLEAVNATINSLTAKLATIGSLSANEIEAVNAAIKNLEAQFADIEYIDAKNIEAITAEIESLQAVFGTFEDISTEDLDALNAYIATLTGYTAEFTYVSAEVLSAVKASIKELETKKLSVEDAEIKYANIDFANIGEAAIRKLFSDYGLIKDLIVENGSITGELVGVTIKGDLIEGNTIKADKLVIKGSDGLYYKLNTDGVTTEAEQTDYNSLNGQVIAAKSITATKINVSDLVAFGATIGGFKITDKAIYSGVKASALNSTRGIYQDSNGQFAIGDATNFFRYYLDEDGTYKLEISADSVKIGTKKTNVETVIENAILSTVEEFYLSSSPTELTGGEWSPESPKWSPGKYIWRRTLVTYGDNSKSYTPDENGVCISGNDGPPGKDAAISSDTPPEDTSRLWCDTSGERPVLKQFNGTEWVIVNDYSDDLEDTSNELGQAISDLSTSITSTAEAVILEALKSYTETTDFDSFKETIESQLTLLADSMTLQFSETTSQIEEINSDLQSQLNEITKYFTFDINGMTIGQVDNPNKVVIDNDEIVIMVNGNPVQRFDSAGKGIIPSLEVSNEFRLFDYLITQDSDGTVNFEYVGE